MATSRLVPGSQYFADPRSGRPVASAMIYIGAPNTDPTVLANRVTVNLIKQDGSVVVIPAASQPLTTTAGGLLSYLGSAVQAQVPSGAYSIALHDSGDVPLDYFPSVESAISVAANTLQSDNFYTNDASSASNAYVIIPPVTPAPDVLLDGQEITFRPSDNGSGAATINVMGNSGPIGAHPWVLPDGSSDLTTDYVKTSRDYKVRWNSATSKFVDQDMGLFSYNPSIQAWNAAIDYYKVPSFVVGSDLKIHKSIATSGPNLGGSVNPVGGAAGKWIPAIPDTSGHLTGLSLSNNAGTPATIIDISSGSARDSTNLYDLVSSGSFSKKINAVWAAGTGNGGFPSTLSGGAPVNNTCYSFWVIGKTDGTVDFGFDSMANGIANTPTLLLADATHYTLFRRIGYIEYGVATIIKFFQDDDTFYYDVPIQDLAFTSASAAGALHALTVPATLTAVVLVETSVPIGADVELYGLITAPKQTNTAPTIDINNYITRRNAAYTWPDSNVYYIQTDSSSQIRERFSTNDPTISLKTIGWIDSRGK